jgi:hypothetical protein
LGEGDLNWFRSLGLKAFLVFSGFGKVGFDDVHFAKMTATLALSAEAEIRVVVVEVGLLELVCTPIEFALL